MPQTNSQTDWLDEILDQFDPFDNSHNDFIRRKPVAKAAIQQTITKREIELLEGLKKKATWHCAFKINQSGTELDTEDERLAIPATILQSEIEKRMSV